MLLLLLVSFLWAFSFGLIKGRLSGLDPVAAGAVRLAIAALLFLPWTRFRGLPSRLRASLAAVGAVQFGLMYIAYMQAFVHLQAFEVALFTIFTPLYLVLLDGLRARRWELRHAAAAALAVAGAGVALWQSPPGSGVLEGFLYVQASNLCFAAGQLAYRQLRRSFPPGLSDVRVFGWLLLGAVLATALASLGLTDWTTFRPRPLQWAVLLYLGAIASALGFFLWNVGATRVNAGTLASFNNAKVPLGIACSLLFFNERADVTRLLASFALLAAAVWLAERRSRAPNA